MSGRTQKLMIAETTVAGEVEYRTAGKWTVAGVVLTVDPANNHPGKIAAVGCSWGSVTSRTVAESRRVRPWITKKQQVLVMEVVSLVEATAPVVREYFGTHRVTVTEWFDGKHWVAGRRSAGRTELRKMAREGVTSVQFSQGLGRKAGTRTPDFTMAELLKSMNKRSA